MKEFLHQPTKEKTMETIGDLKIPEWMNEFGVDVEAFHKSLNRHSKFEPGEERPYFSWSQISTVMACPRRYYWEYIMGVREPAPYYLTLGGSAHAAIEAHCRSLMGGGRGLRRSKAQEAFRYFFTQGCEQEEVDFKDRTVDDVVDEGVELVGLYMDAFGKELNPIYTEFGFNIALGQNFPKTLLGYIDIVDKNREGGVMIRDTKFVKRTPSQADVDRDMQLSLFSLGYRVTTGEVENGLQLDCVVKLKNPVARPVVTYRSAKQLEGALRMVESAAATIMAMEKDKPQSAHMNTRDTYCKRGGCSAWNSCLGAYGY